EAVDPQGNGIAGLWISAGFRGQDPTKPIRGITGSDGHLLLDGFPRVPVTLSVHSDDPMSGRVPRWGIPDRRLKADADSARIVIGPFRLVRGRVRDEDAALSGKTTISGGKAGF